MLRRFSLAALVCATSFYSCKKTAGPTGPQGPAGPSFTGAIAGNAALYDEWGAPIYSGVNGIQITLKNGKQQVTDSNGHFLFPNITTGNYTLRSSATGYGSTLVPNVTFISDTAYQVVSMTRKPSFDLVSFTAYHNPGSAYDSLVATAFFTGTTRKWVVFAGKSSSPSADGNYKLMYSGDINAGAGRSVIKVPASDLNAAGIFYGETVYYTAYSYVVTDHSSYTDIATGKVVYTPVGTSLSDTTIAP